MDLEFEKLINEEAVFESNDSEFVNYGRKYKTKKFKSDKDANDFMSKNDKYGVIGTKGKDSDYEVHVADVDDEGEEVTESKDDKFTDDHLDKLRAEYEKIDTIDPLKPAYKKLTDYLDGMDQKHLKQIAGAKVKFLSSLAKNRLKEGLSEGVKLDTFVKYCMDFYNEKSGLYPIKGITDQIIKDAVGEAAIAGHEFGDGDSVDREKVRDIILNNLGKDAWLSGKKEEHMDVEPIEEQDLKKVTGKDCKNYDDSTDQCLDKNEDTTTANTAPYPVPLGSKKKIKEAKDSIIQKAFEAGVEANKAGKKKVPALDRAVMDIVKANSNKPAVDILSAWHEGFQSVNDEAADKVLKSEANIVNEASSPDVIKKLNDHQKKMFNLLVNNIVKRCISDKKYMSDTDKIDYINSAWDNSKATFPSELHGELFNLLSDKVEKKLNENNSNADLPNDSCEVSESATKEMASENSEVLRTIKKSLESVKGLRVQDSNYTASGLEADLLFKESSGKVRHYKMTLQKNYEVTPDLPESKEITEGKNDGAYEIQQASDFISKAKHFLKKSNELRQDNVLIEMMSQLDKMSEVLGSIYDDIHDKDEKASEWGLSIGSSRGYRGYTRKLDNGKWTYKIEKTSSKEVLFDGSDKEEYQFPTFKVAQKALKDNFGKHEDEFESKKESIEESKKTNLKVGDKVKLDDKNMGPNSYFRDFIGKELTVSEILPYEKEEGDGFLKVAEIDEIHLLKWKNVKKVEECNEEVKPEFQRKKFRTTLENHLNKVIGDEYSIDDHGDHFILNLGDVVAPDVNGEQKELEDLKDGLSELFWDMKVNNTYADIHPNWWGMKDDSKLKITFTKEDEDADQLEEMRTKTLNVDGKKQECILMAGAKGVKIYSCGDKAVLVKGKEVKSYSESDPEYKKIMAYVNLPYQPANMKDDIKAEFQKLISEAAIIVKSNKYEKSNLDNGGTWIEPYDLDTVDGKEIYDGVEVEVVDRQEDGWIKIAKKKKEVTEDVFKTTVDDMESMIGGLSNHYMMNVFDGYKSSQEQEIKSGLIDLLKSNPEKYTVSYFGDNPDEHKGQALSGKLASLVGDYKKGKESVKEDAEVVEPKAKIPTLDHYFAHHVVKKGKDIDGVTAQLQLAMLSGNEEYVSDLFKTMGAKKNNMMDLAKRIMKYVKKNPKLQVEEFEKNESMAKISLIESKIRRHKVLSEKK